MSSPCFAAATAAPSQSLTARRTSFADIPRSDWDRLLALTPRATPFSRWTFHRAWWDAYGSTAHEEYLVCTRGDDDEIRGIVPLMHRHEVEPDDEVTATALRRRFHLPGTAVPATAKAVFFGASYHADYATVLCAPDDLEEVASAAVDALAETTAPGAGQPWDVVDLRRLRDDDPALPALEETLRGCAPVHGWQVVREQEDVCPVLEFPADSWDGYLATLDKAGRHEIRRKWRRVEAAGEVAFRVRAPTPEIVDRFIELHQGKWGGSGLFPDTEGGRRSRRFIHRLAELEAADGDAGQLQFATLELDGHALFIGVGFDDGLTCYFYNAGIDPNARELSPGVNGTAAYIRDRLEAGRRRFDFLRGDEPYKYEWGAHDHPVMRILVTR